MNSLASKAVAAAYNKLGRVNDLLNGPDPRFVSYRENGKDKKIENLYLHADHCRSFIGKMKIDGSGTYSDDVIIVLLKYFFDHTKKAEKVVIELANKVSELLNGGDSMQGYLDYEEQKNHILALAYELNKKRSKDLEIVDIQDINKRLFDVLNNEGIEGLQGGSEVFHGKTTFDSLDIAKHLYYITKQDPKYLEQFRDLKRGELKDMEGESDYYGLVELAIRINALLHGIPLQSGIALQKKYDALLLKHINPYVKDFPLLENFQIFCWNTLGSETFKGLYFDTDKSEKMVGKLQQKNKFVSKTKNALLLILGLGTGGLATNEVNKYFQVQKQKTATEETIKEIFETKKLPRSGDFGYGEFLGEQKFEQINKYKETIYKRFLLRYGDGNQMRKGAFENTKFTKENIESKIISCFNNQEILNMLGTEYSSSEIAIEDQIIDDYLIPNNIGEFKNNISTTPYEKLLPYTDQFINTILCDRPIQMLSDSTYNDQLISIGSLTQPLLEVIGDFTPKYIGSNQFSFYNYKLALTQFPNTNKQYILAGGDYILDDVEKGSYPLSIEKGKELAIDFLRQTQPVIDELIDLYLYRYYSYDDMHFIGENGPHKLILPPSIKVSLIKDFLKKGLLFKINKKDKTKLFAYIDQFVIEQKLFLAQETGEINTKLLPNGFLSEYEDALKNVSKESSKLGRLPVSSFGKNQTVDHIGQYQTSDGKVYKVGIVEIDGKKYLYGNDVLSAGFGEITYGSYEGDIVAKDYFKTKAKFMEQKILFEKQQKSASQKHIEKPRNLLHRSGIGSGSKDTIFPFYPKK